MKNRTKQNKKVNITLQLVVRSPMSGQNLPHFTDMIIEFNFILILN